MRRPSQPQIFLRYAGYLLWEFRWSLSVFVVLVLGGGLIMHLFYHHEGRTLSYPVACFGVFTLIFVNPTLDLPDEWYLQPLFFILPIIGLGAVADSIVRLAYLMFTKKRNLPEWQQMVASLYRKHVVVVGAGKVGLRVIKGLVELREPVVAIESRVDSPFLEEVNDLHVPVITGDGRQARTLEKAGVAHAKAVILATDDDLANLDAALTARDLNPKIRVVMRLFDDTLARKVGGAFNLPCISPSQVSAPAFIAAATGRKVYHNFQLDGEEVHLTDLIVGSGSRLVGRTVGAVQKEHVVNVIMHRGKAGVIVNPGHDIVLETEDVVMVIAPMMRLVELEAANQTVGPAES